MLLCKNGEMIEVVVDDNFPCRDNGDGTFKPAFSRATSDIWVPLLEKAWAKLNGSYEDSVSGDPSDALQCLTGAPTRRYPHAEASKDLEAFWSKIKLSDSRKYIIAAGTKGQGEEKDESGIILGHAYTVLSVYEFKHNSKDVRLLKLRNPWGNNEWNGAWSDKSELWTPKLRQLCDLSDKDDGIFCIPF